MKLLYGTVIGRILLKLLLDAGVLRMMSRIANSSCSRCMIKPYIRHHRINMTEFEGQYYRNFAEFFARRKPVVLSEREPYTLISPCDAMLSIVPIDDNVGFRVKGIWYSLHELLPDIKTADLYDGGLCMIFRLRAKDYHHFCYIDDCIHSERHDIMGMLHSVQPIALEHEPVFRINKRTWSILETSNFGRVVQIEVGAVLVGGIVHEKEDECARRGEEMGHFELCGSTVILLFSREVRAKLQINENIVRGLRSFGEFPVKIGRPIGTLQ